MKPPPPRLVDDPSLPEDVRAGLRAFQHGRPLGEEASRRIHHMLRSRTSRSRSAGLALRFALVGLLAAGMAGAGIAAKERFFRAPPAPPSFRPLVPSPPSASLPGPRALGLSPPASSSQPPPVGLPAKTLPAPGVVSVAASAPHPPVPQASAPASVDTPPDRPGQALDLLDEARVLVDRNPALALQKLQEHGRRFPGSLATERELLFLRALVRAGRKEEARARAVPLLNGPQGALLKKNVQALLED